MLKINVTNTANTSVQQHTQQILKFHTLLSMQEISSSVQTQQTYTAPHQTQNHTHQTHQTKEAQNNTCKEN